MGARFPRHPLNRQGGRLMVCCKDGGSTRGLLGCQGYGGADQQTDETALADCLEERLTHAENSVPYGILSAIARMGSGKFNRMNPLALGTVTVRGNGCIAGVVL